MPSRNFLAGYIEQTPPRASPADENVQHGQHPRDSLDPRRPLSQVIATPVLDAATEPHVRLRSSSSDDAMSTDASPLAPPPSSADLSTAHKDSAPLWQQGAGADTAYTHRPAGDAPNAGQQQRKSGGNWRTKYATVGRHTAPSTTQTSPTTPESANGLVDEGTSDSAATSSLSTTTGCYISAPLMPPVGYPMPLGQNGRPDQQQAEQHQQQQQQQQQQPAQLPQRLQHHQLQPLQTRRPLEHQPPQPQQQQPQQHLPPLQNPSQPVFDDPRSSVISSSSSGSSKPSSAKDMPPPPQWAQPPKTTGPPGPRAASFDSGLDRSALFNPEHIRGPAGEWVEVLRGEQGRIAVKSTPSQYEVLVWLPGFSINDITIVTRKNQVLHIVADQWDEQDHAQWEIRLGDDAVMTTVRAQFSGQELKITVARSGRHASSAMSVHSNVTMRTASSRGASISGNNGHTMHERSFSTPTQAWGDSDRRDLEARMNRGAEAFC